MHLLLQLKRYGMLMTVTMPREKWTDERLDDLRDEMHRGFADVKAVIAETKAEIADLKVEVRELRREMLAGFFVIVAAIIGSNAL